MTVRELICKLITVEDLDNQVLIALDEEGNEYRKIEDIDEGKGGVILW